MDEILIKLNVELISTLARVTGKLNNRRSRECSLSLTCYLAQPHAVKLVKNFFGNKDINEARQRLDRLIQEEVATTIAQILGGVDRLERKILGGERTHSAWTRPLDKSFSLQIAKHQLTVCRKSPVCFVVNIGLFSPCLTEH